MGDPSTFSCPRCGTPVPAGATRCLACAERPPADAGSPDAASKATTGPDPRKVVAIGCITIALVLVGCAVAAVVLGQKLRETQLKAVKREQQRIIDEERHRYESEQAQRGHGSVHVSEPSGELAILARALPDLAGHDVNASTTLEHGGVVVVYPMGCADCTAKLASAERCVALAHSHNLGAQVIVIHGTVEGVEKDKLPDGMREAALLDADGKVGEALNVRHLTAIVVDPDGSTIVYKGSPEEAAGMIPSVAQGE